MYIFVLQQCLWFKVEHLATVQLQSWVRKGGGERRERERESVLECVLVYLHVLFVALHRLTTSVTSMHTCMLHVLALHFLSIFIMPSTNVSREDFGAVNIFTSFLVCCHSG